MFCRSLEYCRLPGPPWAACHYKTKVGHFSAQASSPNDSANPTPVYWAVGFTLSLDSSPRCLLSFTRQHVYGMPISWSCGRIPGSTLSVFS